MLARRVPRHEELREAAEQDHQDEAVEIAKEHVDFAPDNYQIRYLPQGLPPVYYWAVSLYTVRNGQPAHIEVVLVNATTGAVQDT